MLGHTFMRRLFSLAFWIFLGVSSLACLVVAVVLFVLTTPFDPDRRINHLFSCYWAALYAWVFPGWRVSVRGREHIEHGRAYMLVANHTSGADVVLCFMLFRQFKWVSKASNFRLPVLGWNMRMCRYVPLVRGSQESIANMWRAARYWLDRGISIMMFPEGTRSPDGKLQAFKHGAFTLACEAGVPVVPVVIHGGHALMPKHRGSLAATADLRVEVLEPVSPTRHPDPEVLRDVVHARIAERLEAGPVDRAPVVLTSRSDSPPRG